MKDNKANEKDTPSKLQVIADSAANSLNAIAGLLNHKGLINQAAVLLSVQKIVYELAEAVETDSCQLKPEVTAENEVPAVLRAETPLGAIIARASNDPANPGIWIDLRRPDADCDLQLALVEFTADEGDLPEKEGHIITRVWGNGNQQGYTERVLHEGIEDYFRTEEVEPKEEYVVQCHPTLALCMIDDLGNGPTTENGDRSSQYFDIARGRVYVDRTVSVALIENIKGLPEGKGYYTLHLVDDVKDAPCELYHTADLGEESLVSLLEEILNDLERGGGCK